MYNVRKVVVISRKNTFTAATPPNVQEILALKLHLQLPAPWHFNCKRNFSFNLRSQFHMADLTQTVKTLGGYMGLQLPEGKPYYPDFIKLNTARNSLEYILITRGYRTIYLPYFTCEVLLEPIKRLKIEYHFYRIDEVMDPIIDFLVDDQSCMLYTNYFGIKTDTVKQLSKTQRNLIIDNAQAFYAAPIAGVDTFYSCRKFFGVPDGAYLYTTVSERLELQRDSSIGRVSHLIKAVDQNIEAGYSDYVRNNDVLIDNEIKEMSLLTQKLLDAVDYEYCATKRKENFSFLQEQLGPLNLFRMRFAADDTPMVYPLLVNRPDLKAQLIARKIFVPTYWPNVYNWAQPDSLEYRLTKNIVSLPIDQRYSTADMLYMADLVKSLLINV